MSKDKIILFDDKKNCCACGACMNVCPKDAIRMEEDEYGYKYPIIDYTKCVKCGKCIKICAYKKPKKGNTPFQTLACATKDNELLYKSASGGAFAQLAKRFLEEGGIVYGSTLSKELKVEHVRISNVHELKRLLGSKYVQSDMNIVYKLIKKDLENGNKVLFSGTPCQVDAVRELSKDNSNNLFLIDIICHGVPSQSIFSDFLCCLGSKYNGKVVDFSFRNKSKGQGMTSAFKITRRNGVKKYVCNGKVLSYFSLFLKSYLYRENCYTCPYATKERISDITLGDFWGFHQEHPKINVLNNEKGISCILINTAKGKELFWKHDNDFILVESSFDKVDAHNDQLHQPSIKPQKRKNLLDMYAREGYSSVEKFYKENFRLDRIKQTIVYFFPKRIRKIIQIILGNIISKD